MSKQLSNSALSSLLSAAIAADSALGAVQAGVGVARAGKGQGMEQAGELGRLFLLARKANRALLSAAEPSVREQLCSRP